MINEHLFEKFVPISVFLPYREGGLIALLHEQGKIDSEEHVQGGIMVNGKIPGRMLARYAAFDAKGRKIDNAEQDE
jgi:GTP-binding protein HflX